MGSNHILITTIPHLHASAIQLYTSPHSFRTFTLMKNRSLSSPSTLTQHSLPSWTSSIRDGLLEKCWRGRGVVLGRISQKKFVHTGRKRKKSRIGISRLMVRFLYARIYQVFYTVSWFFYSHVQIDSLLKVYEIQDIIHLLVNESLYELSECKYLVITWSPTLKQTL